MNGTDFLSLTPLMIVAAAPIIIMLTIAFRRAFMVIFWFSLVAFIASLLSFFFVIPSLPHQVSSLLIIDRFTALLSSIILLASIVVTLLSKEYLLYQESEKEEFFIILFIATLGSLILVAANNFITLFLGLETLSISLYIMIAYRRLLDHSIEAGVKYLVLASVSSAFLLFGMGLIYTDTGSLEFSKIAVLLSSTNYSDPLLLIGFGMMLVGLGFKLALVPFHTWTPDIYQGAPVPVATFIATVSKGAVMAVFLRFFYTIRGYDIYYFIEIITLIALVSMFVGNLLAIRQQNVKRILAYSSISNMGYLLVTLLVGGENGIPAAIFYIIAYIFTTLGAFGVIALLSTREHNAEMLEDYKGLFWKRPWIAFVFTLSMLSLAGIPLTAGFMSKFYIVFAGIDSKLWLLVVSLILNSVISIYYYLRVVSTMFSTPNEQKFPAITFTGQFVLGLIVIGIFGLGIFPQWIFQLISGF
ncbi:MAG TPA: NADH-quinone oxidoreductase subunit N [Prolixibacteraceae bacterium]|jgi:NADH-quinone oxidoreductase subunit N|nr:NADH-quinone oxidoreductase subunit N [Prolixibacteraceae bacterium]